MYCKCPFPLQFECDIFIMIKLIGLWMTDSWPIREHTCTFTLSLEYDSIYNDKRDRFWPLLTGLDQKFTNLDHFCTFHFEVKYDKLIIVEAIGIIPEVYRNYPRSIPEVSLVSLYIRRGRCYHYTCNVMQRFAMFCNVFNLFKKKQMWYVYDEDMGHKCGWFLIEQDNVTVCYPLLPNVTIRYRM